MFEAAIKALIQMFSPPFRRVLLKSIGLGAILIVLVGIGLNRVFSWMAASGAAWAEASTLAGVAAHPELARVLEELGAGAFDHELHRRARAHLLGQEPADGELTPLLAELYALADSESITLPTAKQLLLGLRERELERELAAAANGRVLQLQQALIKVREQIRELD